MYNAQNRLWHLLSFIYAFLHPYFCSILIFIAVFLRFFIFSLKKCYSIFLTGGNKSAVLPGVVGALFRFFFPLGLKKNSNSSKRTIKQQRLLIEQCLIKWSGTSYVYHSLVWWAQQFAKLFELCERRNLVDSKAALMVPGPGTFNTFFLPYFKMCTEPINNRNIIYLLSIKIPGIFFIP